MAEAVRRLGLVDTDYSHVVERVLLTVGEWLDSDDGLASSCEIAVTVRRGQFWCMPSGIANSQG
jgi:hypothetical protein